MSANSSVSLEKLNAVGPKEFEAALGTIYEHSPWVAQAATAGRPFGSLAALHECMSRTVLSADDSRKLALLNAHPDLAGKAARAGAITADSKIEQRGAGLDHLTEKEFSDFQSFNERYRKTFGFPFIICVLRHTKDSVLRHLERRAKNTLPVERETAVKEVIRIAALRLDRHVSAKDRLKVTGRLSTHALDAYSGRPAHGVAVELRELSNSGTDSLIATAVTNADGRTDEPLIHDRPVPIGRYELRFDVAGYFARLGVVLPDPPFLDVVPLRFSVADPEGHYHVPLLATPWSYSTYRGS
ncbi:MAG TPA: 2-oxo-4-hydroxy-4-carboxy-5-ureidoimidazoline decarboxylase [Pseudolabrys sp.]|nr:2-oxo-4-hydroxy-4-carboxy-5-ureidoimidazoline decarboxylase [Pseudolabrys sp.]